MRFFSRFLMAVSLGIAVTSGARAALAEDPSCEVVERRLVCANGAKQQWKTALALANPKTIENIRDAERGDKLFVDPMERERFRLSVERARKKLQIYSNRQHRRYKRRRLSAEDYASVRERYEAGMNSYYTAMGLFHSKEWFSNTRDTQAEGDD